MGQNLEYDATMPSTRGTRRLPCRRPGRRSPRPSGGSPPFATPRAPESKALYAGRRTPAEIAAISAAWLATGELPTPTPIPVGGVVVAKYGRGGATYDPADPYAPGSGRPHEIAAKAARAAVDARAKAGLRLKRYGRDTPPAVVADRTHDEYATRRLREFYATRVNV